MSGCSDSDEEARDRTRKAEASAAQRLSERAVRDSEALLAQYDAALLAHPDLGSRLSPLRHDVAEHRAAFHAASFLRGKPSPGATSPSPGATASGSATAAGATPEAADPAPADARGALAALAASERKLADSRSQQLVDAPDELARLLASVSASGAAHAYLLTEGKK
ncbi:hypothetical protein AB0J21_32235 [Streptomyces sp. NPDC049954]|uniref:hypothetical protein n=1 Tax=Streptomyces sp. NPDC049954 TaxID=3155779 RepID=UPI00341FF94A